MLLRHRPLSLPCSEPFRYRPDDLRGEPGFTRVLPVRVPPILHRHDDADGKVPSGNNPFGICDEMDTRVEFGRCGKREEEQEEANNCRDAEKSSLHTCCSVLCRKRPVKEKTKGGLRHPLNSAACTTGDYFFASSSTSCRKFFFHRFLIRRTR